MKRKRMWMTIAGTVAAAGVAAGALNMRFRFEEARYDVVEDRRDFEIRRYAPRVVAEVDCTHADPQEATREGFRILADYIFGNNIRVDATNVERRAASDDASMKIAMTTPVDRVAKGDRWTVRFTLPSAYALDDLPKPVNPRVRLVELEPSTVAAIRFSGSPSENAVQQRMDALVSVLRRQGFRPTGDAPIYARYDPPWTPAFLKRNEVLVEVQALGTARPGRS